MKPSSKPKSNRFDLIASGYDFIGRLVFGEVLLDAQCVFLNEIKLHDEVLILGGGTGKILESFPKCHSIHFVDLSSKMITLAKERNDMNSIKFEEANFLTHDFDSTSYDVIICPFFLDCFDESNLKEVVLKIKELLKNDGRLIVTDFQKTNHNRFLLNLMHYFFRFSASLESKNLKNIHEEVELVGFRGLKSKYFHRNMIFSRLYGNL